MNYNFYWSRLWFFCSRNKLLLMLLLSLILKFTLLIILGPQPFLDGKGYMQIAEKIYNNSFIYPSDEIIDAPGTPYFYALFYPFVKYFGISSYSVGNIVLATALIPIIYKTTLVLFKNQKNAFAAALMCTIYPSLNFYSITILTETLYIFVLYFSLYLFLMYIISQEKKDLYAFLFGIAWGIGTLIRFSNLAMFPFFVILAMYIQWKSKINFQRAISIIALMIIGFLTIMSVWWYRNYQVLDQFVMTSVGLSGHVFYSGNNAKNKSGGGIGGVDVDPSIFAHISDPVKRDKAMWEAGLEWIKNNPGDWLLLEVKKLKRFYSPFFYAPQYNKWYYNLMSLVSYGSILIFSFIGLWLHRKSPLLYSPYLLYMLLLTGIHMVFIVSMRYRLPIEPFLIVMASMPVTKLIFNRNKE